MKQTLSLIRCSQLLLIGSAGRNTGKTLFACRLIKEFTNQYSLVGLKVTAITENNGRCPRGGEGCGVCSSLQGAFEIIRETRQDLPKDTSRLLAAGAAAVYWLKVLRTELAAGFTAFLQLLPAGSLVVCESNSLRTVVKPGLFLMLRKPGQPSYKTSAEQVKALAERIITFDGQDFDFDFRQLTFSHQSWQIKEE